MRLKVPMTGTVLSYDANLAKIDGIGITGDPMDPVRPIGVSLGNVSWRLISVDLDNDLMEIEVTPGKEIKDELSGKPRDATDQEKEQFLQNAKNIIESRTPDELYALSKEPKLKKPVKL